jgi:hypothetical protein
LPLMLHAALLTRGSMRPAMVSLSNALIKDAKSEPV